MTGAEDAVTSETMTMAGKNLDGEYRATGTATQAAAGQLPAPVLKAMREAGLAGAGYRAGTIHALVTCIAVLPPPGS